MKKFVTRLPIFALFLSLLFSSCAKKPQDLLNSGMKSFAAGDYQGALEDFADGIKKGGDTGLYAGFVSANLVTGKYPNVNSAYNRMTDDIRSSLLATYGNRVLMLGVGVDSLLPYKVSGGNILPADFPETVRLQAAADYQGYLELKQEIDNSVGK